VGRQATSGVTVGAETERKDKDGRRRGTTDQAVTKGLRKKQNGCGHEEGRGALVYTLALTHPTLNVKSERAENTLIAQGWFGDKPCLVTIDTEACVTIARPYIVAGTKIAMLEVSITRGTFP
jgi:hypothetical protein